MRLQFVKEEGRGQGELVSAQSLARCGCGASPGPQLLGSGWVPGVSQAPPLLQVLLYGGRKDGSGLDSGLPCNDVLTLSTDAMKWEAAGFKGALNAPTRYGHAVCCIREKVGLLAQHACAEYAA